MVLEITLVVLGFVLLIFGADALVKGSSALAKKLNMSDLAIGLTIVAFGTSAPELVVSSVAAVNEQSDLILGNVLGSNLFNLMMILGIVGLIKPISVQRSMVWIEIPISMSVIVMLYILSNSFFGTVSDEISWGNALVLLLLFVGFMYYIYRGLSSEANAEVDESTPAQHYSTVKMTLMIVFGLAGLVYGGHLVVTNATFMALQFGVSEKVIGLTIVAAGTSLPELVTSIVAALKKNADIAIGNVIGSNIFNVLLIVPVSALINPIAYNSTFNFEMYLLVGATLFLFVAMFTGKAKRLDRWEALILLIGFVVYTGYMLSK